MASIAKLLYLLGVIPTVGGIAVLVALAPRPTPWKESRKRALRDHFQGIARYMIVLGAALSGARVLMGWTPSWDVVVLILGLGLGMAIYARESNLIALAHEKLDKVLGASH